MTSDIASYEQWFQAYCRQNGLTLTLSFAMPAGYEDAYGMFDPTIRTLFINQKLLQARPECERMFHLFHELRHASQYLQPEQFDDLICRSRFYIIMYDGSCYKLVDNQWKECKLEGTTAEFTELYLGQPYERDANDFAFKMVQALAGESEELRELYSFCVPKEEIPARRYEALYAMIDVAVG